MKPVIKLRKFEFIMGDGDTRKFSLSQLPIIKPTNRNNKTIPKITYCMVQNFKCLSIIIVYFKDKISYKNYY